MGFLDKFKNKNKADTQETKRNEINNTALKESLGNTALSLLKQGVEYDDLSGLTLEFGYVFDISGRGVEALFKVNTDKGIFYFAVQKSSLMRIDISEEVFALTTEQFLEMHS